MNIPLIVVFSWRSTTPDRKVWLSERYLNCTSELASARTKFRKALRGKGRLIYAKLHTGTAYGNRGRFV